MVKDSGHRYLDSLQFRNDGVVTYTPSDGAIHRITDGVGVRDRND